MATITGQSVDDAHDKEDRSDDRPRDSLSRRGPRRIRDQRGSRQTCLRHRDGSLRWLELIGAPPSQDKASGLATEQTMLSLFRDMTAEIEANHRAEELTRVLDASTDLVMIVDPTDFRLRWANDALAHFLRIDVATGTSLTDILDGSSALVFDQVARPALAHQSGAR